MGVKVGLGVLEAVAVAVGDGLAVGVGVGVGLGGGVLLGVWEGTAVETAVCCGGAAIWAAGGGPLAQADVRAKRISQNSRRSMGKLYPYFGQVRYIFHETTGNRSQPGAM